MFSLSMPFILLQAPASNSDGKVGDRTTSAVGSSSGLLSLSKSLETGTEGVFGMVQNTSSVLHMKRPM